MAEGSEFAGRLKMISKKEDRETPEYIECAGQLEKALQSDREIAHHLHRKKFISKEVYEDGINAKSTLTAIAKAGELVGGIRRKVEMNIQCYRDLMEPQAGDSPTVTKGEEARKIPHHNPHDETPPKKLRLERFRELRLERFHEDVEQTDSHDPLTDHDIIAVTSKEKSSKFPYLKTPDLTDYQRDKLKGRLKMETKVIRNEFAILIGRTMSGVKKRDISLGELKAVIQRSSARNGNKLLNKMEGVTTHDEVFVTLYHFLSFFDNEILGIIIRSFCFDLKPDFDEYISKLKEYCKRRVCEVPDDSCGIEVSKSEGKKNLHIQIDQNFIDEVERIKMADMKELSDTLRKILDTDLRILKITVGSLIITFHSLHELDVLFPLSSKQEEELREIGVVKIYSEEQEYYRYSPPPTEEPSS